MTGWLDDIARFFSNLGIHPVLGAFVAGVIVVLVVRARRVDKAVGEGFVPGGALQSHLADKSCASSLRLASASASMTVGSLTVPIPPETLGELLPMLREGRKIEAITLVRERTGLGLAESKSVVDHLAASPLAR